MERTGGSQIGELSPDSMFPSPRCSWQLHDSVLARYLLAVASPVVATFFAAQGARYRDRSDNAAAVAPGLGLGLYIASAIVRRHGGRLEATGRESGGSVFTLQLPLSHRGDATFPDNDEKQSRRSSYQYAS